MTNQKPTSRQEEIQIHSEDLISDFKALMADAEDLIKATASHDDGPLSAIRSKTLETLNSAKESLSSVEGTVTEKAKVVAERTDEFVHRNPWEAVGIAAGIGLLLGLLIRRH
jgi:ElaB/YqjD/DUF883 family membrane-anchored ribosome-binding protein